MFSCKPINVIPELRELLSDCFIAEGRGQIHHVFIPGGKNPLPSWCICRLRHNKLATGSPESIQEATTAWAVIEQEGGRQYGYDDHRPYCDSATDQASSALGGTINPVSVLTAMNHRG
ncbi:hypothetical protein GCM10025790_01120 [Nesterenkonia rhizosphaerae]|uniref:Uncharacterized protein n=1 Tax=Nesterenkonia rhizosphaerae TaxID=1348272 RepID=A0ABP9FNK8_9MICC